MRQIIILTALFIGTLQHSEFKTAINEISGFENLTPKLKDINDFFKEKCVQNGANETTFNSLTKNPIELNSCLENYLNYTEMNSEIEESKKTGSMDQVFKKYCSKYPKIYECLKSATDTLRPCLNLSEQTFLDKGLEFVGTLKEYMCFKDGNRIALFISQGGVECMELKKNNVQECINETLGESLSKNTLPELSQFNGSTLCKDLFKIRSCFYENLTTCKQNIPANVIDAFFRFLKKYVLCDVVYEESLTGDLWIRFIAVILFLLLVALISYKLASYNGDCPNFFHK